MDIRTMIEKFDEASGVSYSLVFSERIAQAQVIWGLSESEWRPGLEMDMHDLRHIMGKELRLTEQMNRWVRDVDVEARSRYLRMSAGNPDCEFECGYPSILGRVLFVSRPVFDTVSNWSGSSGVFLALGVVVIPVDEERLSSSDNTVATKHEAEILAALTHGALHVTNYSVMWSQNSR